MKKELQDKLYNKYPKLFGQENLSMRHTAMCWGIETGDGWYNIIDGACRLIQSHIKQSRSRRAFDLSHNRRLRQALSGNKTNLYFYYSNRLGYKEEEAQKAVEKQIEKAQFRKVEEAVPQVQFTQIKEKFGTLRMYTTHIDDYIDGVISMADSMSCCTCEVCGVPGGRTKGGWITTLCRRCSKEQGRELISEKEEEDEESY